MVSHMYLQTLLDQGDQIYSLCFGKIGWLVEAKGNWASIESVTHGHPYFATWFDHGGIEIRRNSFGVYVLYQAEAVLDGVLAEPPGEGILPRVESAQAARERRSLEHWQKAEKRRRREQKGTLADQLQAAGISLRIGTDRQHQAMGE